MLSLSADTLYRLPLVDGGPTKTVKRRERLKGGEEYLPILDARDDVAWALFGP
jgi:hypothetical protein